MAQISRSWSMRFAAPNRVAHLVSRFLDCDNRPRNGRSVLCVGCRNAHELSLFRDAGFEHVVGIDLFSTDPAILQMDMHSMSFPDNHFDVIFSSHSLEHSYDSSKVLSEYARVLRDGAVCIIEVPIRFRKFPGRTDLQDFESVRGLRSACKPFAGKTMLAEESPTVARLIFTVARPALVAEHPESIANQ